MSNALVTARVVLDVARARRARATTRARCPRFVGAARVCVRHRRRDADAEDDGRARAMASADVERGRPDASTSEDADDGTFVVVANAVGA